MAPTDIFRPIAYSGFGGEVWIAEPRNADPSLPRTFDGYCLMIFNLSTVMMRSHALLNRALFVPATMLVLGLTASAASAQLYNPESLSSSREITDTLSTNDIPTGFGGFARDYVVNLQAGDQITIDVTSEEFDTLVS